MTDLLSITQAAARLGLTPGRVRQLAQSGKLPAFRVGNAWVVKEADLATFQPAPRGWPRDRSRKPPAGPK